MTKDQVYLGFDLSDMCYLLPAIDTFMFHCLLLVIPLVSRQTRPIDCVLGQQEFYNHKLFHLSFARIEIKKMQSLHSSCIKKHFYLLQT